MRERVGGGDRVAKPATVAVIANGAYSIANFRGPLIRAMVGQGLQVYALAPDYDESTRRAVAGCGAIPVDISLERAGMRPVRDLVDGWRLYRLLRRLKPDLTFAYFIKPVIYGSIAARLAGVKRRYALVAGLGYVYAAAGRLTVRQRLLRGLVSRLYKAGFRACDRVFFQNDEDVAHFVDGGMIEPSKVRRLNGTGVDLDHFGPEPAVTEPVRFLLMARLLRAKGIEDYVAAARIVRSRGADCEFLLLGDFDPNPDGLDRATVEAWQREGIVTYPGHIDDVRAWIARSSVYVLPSRYREGVPRSSQEAMAMARPVVTTDNVGCRDTVVDGVSGFLVPIGDVDALAAAMMRFVEDRSLIERMGRESRRLAEQRFDVHAINREILRTMGIDGGEAPSPRLTVACA